MVAILHMVNLLLWFALMVAHAQTPDDLKIEGPVGSFVYQARIEPFDLIPWSVQRDLSELSESKFYQSPYHSDAIKILHFIAGANRSLDEKIWAVATLIKFGVFGSKRGGPEEALVELLVASTNLERVMPLVKSYLLRPESLFGANPDQTLGIHLGFYQVLSVELLKLAQSRSKGRVGDIMHAWSLDLFLAESLHRLKAEHLPTWNMLTKAVRIEAAALRSVKSEWLEKGLPPETVLWSEKLLTRLGKTARKHGMRTRLGRQDCEEGFSDFSTLD